MDSISDVSSNISTTESTQNQTTLPNLPIKSVVSNKENTGTKNTGFFASLKDKFFSSGSPKLAKVLPAQETTQQPEVSKGSTQKNSATIFYNNSNIGASKVAGQSKASQIKTLRI